jgi:hypothetical protein
VQIRSNVSYLLAASATSSGTNSLRGLYVTGARATGRFVSVDAVAAINVAAPFNGMTIAGRAQNASQNGLSYSSPAMLLTGPRISTAGTFNSPHNAVEVLVLAEIEPPAESTSQSLELIISAAPQSALTATLSPQ